MDRTTRAGATIAERRTLEGVIYDELRSMIISLKHPPRSMIFENVGASETVIGRTPVRQALSRLANEELLRVLPQRRSVHARAP
jgi:DNA-binding GntR family transcriptional regulator